VTVLRFSRAVASGLLVALASAMPPRAQAQPPASASAAAPSTQPTSTSTTAAGERRSVSGRVRRPMGERGDSTGMGPAVGVWVTLHRVARDGSGALDSVRTDAAGRYALRYVTRGAADAIYFASSTWHGIAYFTAPLRTTNATGDEAEITVFDTTSRPIELAVKGRHLVVGKADTGDVHTIIEVFELGNDSLQTLVAAGNRPTWRTRIPKAARNVRANEGELSPETFAAGDGEVRIVAPFAPGLKQLSFTYVLPASAFPFAIDAEGGAVVFEVLLEDEGARVEGEGFTKVAPVTLEGRRFQRWLAQDLRADSRLAVIVPARGALSSTQLRNYGIAIAAGFFALLLIGRSMQRSRARGTSAGELPARPTLRPREPDAPLADRLAAEIAALDATYARQSAPSDAVRQAYEARRAELKAALAAVLAGHDIPT